MGNLTPGPSPGLSLRFVKRGEEGVRRWAFGVRGELRPLYDMRLPRILDTSPSGATERIGVGCAACCALSVLNSGALRRPRFCGNGLKSACANSNPYPRSGFWKPLS